MKLEDIAKMAGVSKSAVSLALSGKPGISESTRERILQIVRETGYIPRSMVKAEQIYGTANAFRFITYTNSGIVLQQYYQQPFFMELIQYVEEKCRIRGYSLMFSAADIDHFERDIHQLTNRNESSGIILLGTNLSREQIEKVIALHPYVVVLDTCYETLNAHFVVMNNVKGAYDIATHLMDWGHTRIGYVQSNSRMYNFDMRKKGFHEAAASRGIKIDHYFSVSPTLLVSQEQLKQQILQLKQANRDLPTALFCECDYIAISVIKSLAEIGIRVPEDISVVGFDNIRETQLITPELTTVHVEKETMAAVAVDTLANMIENKNEHNVTSKTWIDTSVILRDSTKKLEVVQEQS